MTDSGSHLAEVLSAGRGGSGAEKTDSGSHLVEVLSGGRGGSRAEKTDSGSHLVEVLGGGTGGSGAGLTANALSECTIALASFSTIVPLECTRLLNRPALLDLYFS